MKIQFLAVLAGAGLAMVLAAPATAKPVRHNHHAQSPYDYRAASPVREAFHDAPRGRWARSSREVYYGRTGYRERREDLVVENLRGEFTGGVGYGADGGAGFVDGYGQTHYFVGSFRSMNSLPHGPYRPAPSRGHGF